MSTKNPPAALGGTASYIDERFASANFAKRMLNKVFPDHWSFMLGEIALYSFIVILLSGTYLTLWFKPSMVEVVYNGSYAPLQGIKMSEAYASTLDISFDVRGGLLMRQIHHWAALFFVGAISAHMMRVFFTGAFRKPREFNWVIGVLLLALSWVEGFAGYSLPDDLLSGTGLRITQGLMQATPILGTYMAFYIFGGEFPGSDFISRLYSVHILLVPGIILGLVTAHLIMVFYQKHTQWAGPGRTESNVVGYRLYPIYMAKAGGFFFVVFGFITMISALVTINPIWLYGPYTPSQVTAGSQPDWYMGWLDGAVRIMPNWESNIGGYLISWNVLVPAMLLPTIIIGAMVAYPWLEAWVTGDKREHHILDRPRNAPVRTGLGAAMLSLYLMLLISSGNDIIATAFHMSINQFTVSLRVLVFVVPILVFEMTRRIALGLQRRDHEKLLHGIESGNILRLPHGEFIEIHAPLPIEEKARILAKTDIAPVAELPAVDGNGVANPKAKSGRLRAKLSRAFYGENVALPTAAEMSHHEIEQH